MGVGWEWDESGMAVSAVERYVMVAATALALAVAVAVMILVEERGGPIVVNCSPCN